MGNTYSRYINPSRNRINPIGEYGLGREILERIEQYRVVEPENQEKIDCSYVPYPLQELEIPKNRNELSSCLMFIIIFIVIFLN